MVQKMQDWTSTDESARAVDIEGPKIDRYNYRTLRNGMLPLHTTIFLCMMHGR